MVKKLLAFAAIGGWAALCFGNEHTFVFDGDNNIGTLERQTSLDEESLTFVDSFSYSEAGIDFTITKQNDEGRGFALVNAGGVDAGIYVYAKFPGEYYSISPDITLKVPNGKITGAKLYLSGSGLLSLGINFNGKDIDSDMEGALYYWEWSDPTGSETLSIKWENSFVSRFIHSIEVSYVEDLGGKLPSDISFDVKSVEAIVGQPVTLPELQNPHNLSVVWSSSNPDVATVDENGKVELIGRGKTSIIASTEGNDTYARGNAAYDLTVVPSAATIKELSEFAENVYDRVYVNFPATVAYGNGTYAFVTDAVGNAACFENTKFAGSSSVSTIYSVGDVIPAGWIASNLTINASVTWQGIPPAVKDKVEVKYPEVDSFSAEDADRVLILRKVTFKTQTPTGFETVEGTCANGDVYYFHDVFNIGAKAAGTYDVTGVVRYSKTKNDENLIMAPIAYTKSSETGITNPEAGIDTPRYFNLQGLEVTVPENGIYVRVTGDRREKVVVKGL